jgi:hypothetical protein
LLESGVLSTCNINPPYTPTYLTTNIYATGINNGFVYYSSGTNYGIRVDCTNNRLIIYNCDASASYSICTTNITNTYYIASICISNNVLYAIVTGKTSSVIGTGLNVYSVNISSINLATVGNITLSSITTASIPNSIILINNNAYVDYLSKCTMGDNNNLYITTYDSGIYVFNTINSTLTQFMAKSFLDYTFASIATWTGSSGTTSTTNRFSAMYSNIAYNSSSNSLFLQNVSNYPGETPIDVININKVNNITPYIYFNSGYFTPAGYARITVGRGMGFDANNNFYYTNMFTAVSGGIENGIYIISKIICFKEDTQILTYDGYKLIQELKKGDLIKTSQNGYKPIYKIGYAEITHPCSEERIKDQLYKCSTENFPEVFEDLVLTGCHCILVDKFKDEKEREEAKKINMVNANDTDDDFITENKYRLPACIDERTTVYEVEGEHTIYHFALENDDYYMNYGVYANGLLVESTSKRFMDQQMINELE